MSEFSRKNSKTGIQVIARACDILNTIGAHPDGKSLAELACLTGLPRSTVQRITGALQQEGFLTSDGYAGQLRIGPGVMHLADQARQDIVRYLRPLLLELTERTGETTDLSVMRREGMVFLDQSVGLHRLRAVSAVGEVFNLTTSANGKACLALLPKAQVKRVLEREWARTRHKGDLDAMLRELADIQSSGLAYDIDEHNEGVSAIGIAFRDWAGTPHAISIPVPSPRFFSVREEVEAALSSISQRVSKIVGIDS
ncbi:IclR family transcriptional regulator [Halomonas sp. LR5S13]|uniref:IclR family transcriptional regulator n=1 Tax=Halomonas rhizosphaerae TaxID=3043296 RepID=UPI0024A95254|nr:IclR family transcriptional regulator [Halomonas rhizosphaerae]MDI5922673.1 IclR family transcriptional regulator [Halomonas rhizosphaerae]